jgi:hypothetical protein
MTQFPLNLIQPNRCFLADQTGAPSIVVSLLPFVFNSIVVETSIELTNVAIPSTSVVELQGRSILMVRTTLWMLQSFRSLMQA